MAFVGEDELPAKAWTDPREAFVDIDPLRLRDAVLYTVLESLLEVPRAANSVASDDASL